MHGLRKHFLVPLVYILNTITQVTADMIKPTVYHAFPPVGLLEWFCDMKLVQVKLNSCPVEAVNLLLISTFHANLALLKQVRVNRKMNVNNSLIFDSDVCQ